MRNELEKLKTRVGASIGVVVAVSLLLTGLTVHAGLAPPATELYINEILFDDGNPAGSEVDTPNEYVEIRGTPGGEIPSGTYLVGVEGDNSAGTLSRVNFSFDLSGIVLGAEGFLTIFMESTPYTADAGSTVITGPAGGDDGFDGAAGFLSSGFRFMEDPSTTFFLVVAPEQPDSSNNTHLIDTDDDGNPDGAYFDTWTVLDSVSIVDNVNGTAPDTFNVGYGDIIFATAPDADGFLAKTGATIVDMDGALVSYVGRNGNSTGSAETDWVAGVISGAAPNWTLDAIDTFPDSFAGFALDHIGAPNPFVGPVIQVSAQVSSDSSVLRASLLKKIKKAKKKLKKAKQQGQVAKVKRLKKSLKGLKQQLASL